MKSLLASITATCVLALNFSAATAADITARQLKFGHLSPDDAPLGQGALKFAELVAKKSDNKIQIKVYPSGQLGSEAQQIGATQGRTQDFILLSTTPLSSVVKELQIMDFPGIVSTPAEADALLDGPAGKKMLGRFEARNLVGLAFFENGFRHLTNNKKRVVKLEDMRGLKVRVQQSPSSIDVFQRLGTNPVPMSWNQLYTALETRTVDAQENPIATIHAGKLYEVQKYMTLTAHAYGANVLVGSKKLWESLSADERKIITEAAVEARNFQRKLSREKEQALMAEMTASGLSVDRFAPEEFNKLRTAVQPVLEKYSKDIGADVVGEFLAERDKVRAAQR
ncbi:ABC transporter substrate-binding protein [Cupriavidus sp. TA19]|uniref:TRAP transporter substrate-binding protein n=1 Tax=Cupriavidus sp. TA19 TaxID=701108 RepID=UPI00272941A7|nr:TRAP transporter substrate-binding protein [Cupriavidus sp. TA19]GLC97611.1 ABC transporter substrate-binding protein [Cupriavidus sp. TA19]